MELYIVMLGLIILLKIIILNNNKICRRIYCVIIGGMLMYFSMIRYGIGLDYRSYELQYTYINFKNIFKALTYLYFEPGYNLINFLSQYTVWKFQFVIVVCSVVTLGGISYYIYKYSADIFVSFYLYFTLGMYFASYCWIRQYMAISISIFAIPYIIRCDKKKAISIIIIAAFFHYSALCLIPFCFFGNKKIEIKVVTRIVVAALLFFLLWDQMVAVAISIMPKFSSYLGTQYMQGKNLNSLILVILFFILFLIYRKQLLNDNEENVIYVNAMLYAFIISLFQLKVELIDRLPPFLMVYSVFGIPAIIKSYRNRRNSLAFKGLVMLLGIIWFGYTLYKDFSGVVPYVSIYDRT